MTNEQIHLVNEVIYDNISKLTFYSDRDREEPIQILANPYFISVIMVLTIEVLYGIWIPIGFGIQCYEEWRDDREGERENEVGTSEDILDCIDYVLESFLRSFSKGKVTAGRYCDLYVN